MDWRIRKWNVKLSFYPYPCNYEFFKRLKQMMSKLEYICRAVSAARSHRGQIQGKVEARLPLRRTKL